MNKIDSTLIKFEEWFAVLLAVAMIVIIFAQVVSRTFLGAPLSWSEELGRYLFVWLSFMGASIALYYGSHLGIDTLVLVLPKKLQKILILITHFLVLILLYVMINEGGTLVAKTAMQKSAAMRIPMSYAYAALPVSAVLMAFHTIVKIINTVMAIIKGNEIVKGGESA